MLGLPSCCDQKQSNLLLSFFFCTRGLSLAWRTLHRAVSPGCAHGCHGSWQGLSLAAAAISCAEGGPKYPTPHRTWPLFAQRTRVKCRCGSQGQARRQLGASSDPVAGTRRDECCVSQWAEQGPLEEEGNADR